MKQDGRAKSAKGKSSQLRARVKTTLRYLVAGFVVSLSIGWACSLVLCIVVYNDSQDFTEYRLVFEGDMPDENGQRELQVRFSQFSWLGAQWCKRYGLEHEQLQGWTEGFVEPVRVQSLRVGSADWSEVQSDRMPLSLSLLLRPKMGAEGSVVVAGWPMSCVKGSLGVSAGRDVPPSSGALAFYFLASILVVLPWSPLWVGLIINSAFFGLLLYVLRCLNHRINTRQQRDPR